MDQQTKKTGLYRFTKILSLAPDTLKSYPFYHGFKSAAKWVRFSKILEVKKVFRITCSLSDPVLSPISRNQQQKILYLRVHHFEMVPKSGPLFDVSSDQAHMYVYFDINHLEYEPEKPSFIVLNARLMIYPV